MFSSSIVSTLQLSISTLSRSSLLYLPASTDLLEFTRVQKELSFAQSNYLFDLIRGLSRSVTIPSPILSSQVKCHYTSPIHTVFRNYHLILDVLSTLSPSLSLFSLVTSIVNPTATIYTTTGGTYINLKYLA